MLPNPCRAIDANGNTLSDSSGKQYTWDFENRLIQAVVPGTNGGTTTFRYDPFGRRIQKSGPLGTTNYLYDGLRAIEDVDGSGNILAKYSAGGGVDEPLAELLSTTTSYYQQDGVNSVTSLSSSTGVLANTYTFDSFGKLIASSGTLSNRFQYTGREFDPETGTYYYRARYYDPSVGRFASEDPIQFRGGLNFYAYGHGNPISRTDPLGLCPTPEDPKKECGNEAPMSPNSSQNPYPADYFYLNIQANYMYHYGGTNPWGNIVRSCLICMYSHGVDAAAAHSFCYANASSHVPFWDMVWGYAAAINAGLTFVDQQGGVGGPLPYH